MDIFKIAGIGLAATVLAVFIKNQRPEFAIQISLLGAVVIFTLILPYLRTIVVMISDISDRIGIEPGYLKLVLKVMGIAYITQFASELCSDAGETSLASKIELAGKVIIMTLSMPVLYSLLDIVCEIMELG